MITTTPRKQVVLVIDKHSRLTLPSSSTAVVWITENHSIVCFVVKSHFHSCDKLNFCGYTLTCYLNEYKRNMLYNFPRLIMYYIICNYYKILKNSESLLKHVQWYICQKDRLRGLMDKASASQAGDCGFESRRRFVHAFCPCILTIVRASACVRLLAKYIFWTKTGARQLTFCF